MGLRTHSLGWVLLFTFGVGGLGAFGLDHFLTDSFERIEQTAMRKDFQRLLGTLDDAVAQRARGAREWSLWTELRNHLRKPQSGFADENLGPHSLTASGLVWLAVLDLQGRVVHTAVTDPSQDAQAIARMVLSSAKPSGREARQVPTERGRCALVFEPALGPDLVVLCHLSVLDSNGQGPSAGVLLTAERLGPNKLREMGERAALDFNLLPLERGGAEDWKRLESIASSTGQTTLWIQPGEPQHRLRAQVRDLGGEPVAWLELSWPREMRLQVDEVLRGAHRLFIVMAVLLALGAYWVVDWRLVRRLRSLKRQMAAARVGEDWTPRLSVSGKDEIAELADEGNHLLQRIELQVQILAESAQTDPLTQLANRRGFDPRLDAALGRCARNAAPLCLLLIDADHFKRFNDDHGHAAGDRALQVLAAALRQVSRRGGDLAARIGGEEFVLLLEGSTAQVAQDCGAALQAWLAKQPSGETALLARPLTVSIGAAQARPGDSPQALMARADTALYQAKSLGRNRLEWAE